MKRTTHRFLPRASLALALLAAASLTLPATARGPKGGGPGQGQGDPELASARKQLAAATMVAKLELSREQKSALKQILGQARQLRDEQKSSAEVKQHKAKAKALLAKATAEARANKGEVNPDTRAQLEALRAERAPERQATRTTMRELMQSARNVLTPEQQQKLQQARGPKGPGARGQGPGDGACAENPEACMGRRGQGGQGFGPGARGPQARQGKQRGKKMMKLLLSDEFLAELSR